MKPVDFPSGLLVAFDKPVRNGDIHSQSFIVLEGHRDESTGSMCWCELPSEHIGGIQFTESCKITREFEPPPSSGLVNGAQFVPLSQLSSGVIYRVVLKGDFIRDEKHRGVDADHLPPWFPARRYHTGDGVQGGTFESWFTLG
jgi:hypothetical protein